MSATHDALGSQEHENKMWWGPNASGGKEVSAQAPVVAPPTGFDLPTIDLAKWNDPEYRAELIQKTDKDARALGFFYVKTPQAVSSLKWDNVNNTFGMCETLFEKTNESDRVKLAGPHDLSMLHGYQKMASQLGSLSQRAPSVKECLALGRPLACEKCDTMNGTHKVDREVSQCQHESFPPQLREFPTVVNQLRRSMEEVANVLLDIFSLSLGLPTQYLRDRHQTPRSPLRMHHYPPMPHDPMSTTSERAIAAAEHTDYGTITLLLVSKNDPGGLQVWKRDTATWMDIPYRPDCIIVNIGDLLMRWTNDRYVSNIHRVLMPDTAIQKGNHRYSMAYFVTPAKDTLVTPVTLDGEIAKYPNITAGDYGDAKRAANFKTTTSPPLDSLIEKKKKTKKTTSN